MPEARLNIGNVEILSLNDNERPFLSATYSPKCQPRHGGHTRSATPADSAAPIICWGISSAISFAPRGRPY